MDKHVVQEQVAVILKRAIEEQSLLVYNGICDTRKQIAAADRMVAESVSEAFHRIHLVLHSACNELPRENYISPELYKPPGTKQWKSSFSQESGKEEPTQSDKRFLTFSFKVRTGVTQCGQSPEDIFEILGISTDVYLRDLRQIFEEEIRKIEERNIYINPRRLQLDTHTNKSVLKPRPESEELVEEELMLKSWSAAPCIKFIFIGTADVVYYRKTNTFSMHSRIEVERKPNKRVAEIDHSENEYESASIGCSNNAELTLITNQVTGDTNCDKVMEKNSQDLSGLPEEPSSDLKILQHCESSARNKEDSFQKGVKTDCAARGPGMSSIFSDLKSGLIKGFETGTYSEAKLILSETTSKLENSLDVDENSSNEKSEVLTNITDLLFTADDFKKYGNTKYESTSESEAGIKKPDDSENKYESASIGCSNNAELTLKTNQVTGDTISDKVMEKNSQDLICLPEEPSSELKNCQHSESSARYKEDSYQKGVKTDSAARGPGMSSLFSDLKSGLIKGFETGIYSEAKFILSEITSKLENSLDVDENSSNEKSEVLTNITDLLFTADDFKKYGNTKYKSTSESETGIKKPDHSGNEYESASIGCSNNAELTLITNQVTGGTIYDKVMEKNSQDLSGLPEEPSSDLNILQHCESSARYKEDSFQKGVKTDSAGSGPGMSSVFSDLKSGLIKGFETGIYSEATSMLSEITSKLENSLDVDENSSNEKSEVLINITDLLFTADDFKKYGNTKYKSTSPRVKEIIHDIGPTPHLIGLQAAETSPETDKSSEIVSEDESRLQKASIFLDVCKLKNETKYSETEESSLQSSFKTEATSPDTDKNSSFEHLSEEMISKNVLKSTYTHEILKGSERMSISIPGTFQSPESAKAFSFEIISESECSFSDAMNVRNNAWIDNSDTVSASSFEDDHISSVTVHQLTEKEIGSYVLVDTSSETENKSLDESRDFIHRATLKVDADVRHSLPGSEEATINTADVESVLVQENVLLEPDQQRTEVEDSLGLSREDSTRRYVDESEIEENVPANEVIQELDKEAIVANEETNGIFNAEKREHLLFRSNAETLNKEIEIESQKHVQEVSVVEKFTEGERNDLAILEPTDTDIFEAATNNKEEIYFKESREIHEPRTPHMFEDDIKLFMGIIQRPVTVATKEIQLILTNLTTFLDAINMSVQRQIKSTLKHSVKRTRENVMIAAETVNIIQLKNSYEDAHIDSKAVNTEVDFILKSVFEGVEQAVRKLDDNSSDIGRIKSLLQRYWNAFDYSTKRELRNFELHIRDIATNAGTEMWGHQEVPQHTFKIPEYITRNVIVLKNALIKDHRALQMYSDCFNGNNFKSTEVEIEHLLKQIESKVNAVIKWSINTKVCKSSIFTRRVS